MNRKERIDFRAIGNGSAQLSTDASYVFFKATRMDQAYFTYSSTGRRTARLFYVQSNGKTVSHRVKAEYVEEMIQHGFLKYNGNVQSAWRTIEAHCCNLCESPVRKGRSYCNECIWNNEEDFSNQFINRENGWIIEKCSDVSGWNVLNPEGAVSDYFNTFSAASSHYAEVVPSCKQCGNAAGEVNETGKNFCQPCTMKLEDVARICRLCGKGKKFYCDSCMNTQSALIVRREMFGGGKGLFFVIDTRQKASVKGGYGTMQEAVQEMRKLNDSDEYKNAPFRYASENSEQEAESKSFEESLADSLIDAVTSGLTPCSICNVPIGQHTLAHCRVEDVKAFEALQEEFKQYSSYDHLQLEYTRKRFQNAASAAHKLLALTIGTSLEEAARKIIAEYDREDSALGSRAQALTALEFEDIRQVIITLTGDSESVEVTGR